MDFIYILDSFIFFIIAIKLGFTISFMIDKLIDLYGNNEEKEKYGINIKYYRERIEIIFNLLMALLIMILFNPYKHVVITDRTKNLLFLYGTLLIIYVHWEILFPNSEIVKKTLKIVK